MAEISPLGYFSYTAYNQDNQPVTQVNADGRTTASAYDPAGRLITQTWSNAAGVQTNVLTYSYDPVGNMLTAGNAYGSYTFTYDPANRVYTQTDPFNYTLTFGYDNNGNVLTVADSAGGTVTSIYNADNQLATREFTTGAGGTPANVQLRMDLTYTPAGQINTEKRFSDTGGTTLVGQTQFTYLCPCQLAGGDFSRFCERFSQGTGWCSLSQRSMAASQIGWRVAAAHRSSWFPADRQWKQRYTFFSKCAEKDRLCGLCRPCTGHGPRTCAVRRCDGTNVSRSSTSAMPIRQRTARKSTPAMAVVSGIQRRGTRASLFIDSPPHRRARAS